jgi:DNA-3-methyladenine glycosylase II
MQNEILTITAENYSYYIQKLCELDSDLQKVVETYGEPPIWFRQAGFPTLVHIILEQQVSLASALAAFEKLKRAAGDNFSPESFLMLSDEALKSFGFSRQKIAYTRNLAGAILAGDLNLQSLETLSDEAVHRELTKLKGIGRWTADIYLLMCLRRTDAYPVGDLGLIVGVQEVKNLEKRPAAAELETIGMQWQPLRAVATRIVWHYYLSRRNLRTQSAGNFS